MSRELGSKYLERPSVFDVAALVRFVTLSGEVKSSGSDDARLRRALMASAASAFLKDPTVVSPLRQYTVDEWMNLCPELPPTMARQLVKHKFCHFTSRVRKAINLPEGAGAYLEIEFQDKSHSVVEINRRNRKKALSAISVDCQIWSEETGTTGLQLSSGELFEMILLAYMHPGSRDEDASDQGRTSVYFRNEPLLNLTAVCHTAKLFNLSTGLPFSMYCSTTGISERLMSQLEEKSLLWPSLQLFSANPERREQLFHTTISQRSSPAKLVEAGMKCLRAKRQLLEGRTGPTSAAVGRLIVEYLLLPCNTTLCDAQELMELLDPHKADVGILLVSIQGVTTSVSNFKQALADHGFVWKEVTRYNTNPKPTCLAVTTEEMLKEPHEEPITTAGDHLTEVPTELPTMDVPPASEAVLVPEEEAVQEVPMSIDQESVIAATFEQRKEEEQRDDVEQMTEEVVTPPGLPIEDGTAAASGRRWIRVVGWTLIGGVAIGGIGYATLLRERKRRNRRFTTI